MQNCKHVRSLEQRNHFLVIVFNGVVIVPTLLLNAVSLMVIFKASQLKNKPCYFIIIIRSKFNLTVCVFSTFHCSSTYLPAE